jgi:hypothetical protein
MPFLTAGFALGLAPLWMNPFLSCGAVGRWRLGGVGRILLSTCQLMFEVCDLVFEVRDLFVAIGQSLLELGSFLLQTIRFLFFFGQFPTELFGFFPQSVYLSTESFEKSGGSARFGI